MNQTRGDLLAVAALTVLFCALVAAQAHAVIVLDADFDHGSLDEANSSAAGSFVSLAGRDNFNPGQWKWLYFSATGVNDQTVTFQIDDDFNTGGSSLVGHEMVYSYDQENWFFFDNNVRNASADTFTFSNNSAFTQDEVFVAYGLPYSYSQVVDHTNQAALSPWVTPTATANSSLVIGQSPGGVDDLGRVVAPRDMFGYQITDPSATGPKEKVVLLGGVHSNETLGNYTLQGMVDFLLGDSLAAGALRRYAEFYVYPIANPDGRFAGYNRSTVQNEPLDPNRFWDPPLYGGLDDIRVAGDAMIVDTGGNVDYFIDFHSTVNGKDGHFGFVLPDFQSDPVWQNLLTLEPSIGTRNASLITDTGAKFGRDILDAEFSITFETQFLPDENIDRFFTLGENFALAFKQALGVFADLNFDQLLNEQDWLIFIAGAEQDLQGLSPVEAYAMGDLDGDGVNSFTDFGLFRDAFNAANGIGSLELLIAGVPEPNTFTLAWLAVAASLSFRSTPNAPRRDRAGVRHTHGRWT